MALKAVEPELEPSVSKMHVSPAIAKTWLARSVKNRHLSQYRVLSLAEDIRINRWQLNGETIVMASDGTILDGYHRLHAIIEAGKGIDTFVASGIDPDAFMTMDSGKSRTPADVLTIFGYTNGNEHAALGRIFARVRKHGSPYDRGGRQAQPTTQEIVSEVNANPDRFMDAIRGANHSKRTFGGGSALGYCWITFGDIDMSDRDMFFERLADGQGLVEGDPIYALRRALLEVKLRHRNMPQNHMIALIIKAWNAYRMHRKVMLLVFRADEAWPVPA